MSFLCSDVRLRRPPVIIISAAACPLRGLTKTDLKTSAQHEGCAHTQPNQEDCVGLRRKLSG